MGYWGGREEEFWGGQRQGKGRSEIWWGREWDRVPYSEHLCGAFWWYMDILDSQGFGEQWLAHYPERGAAFGLPSQLPAVIDSTPMGTYYDLAVVA